MRILLKRWLRVSVGFTVAVLALTLAGAAYYRVWSWHDLRTYQVMSQECHPVWRELHRGRIRAGQDVEEVIADTQPLRVERYGEFVKLNYHELMSCTVVEIMAKNGRLVYAVAGSSSRGKVYFDGMTDHDWKAYRDAYEAHWLPIRKQRAEAERAAQVNDGER